MRKKGERRRWQKRDICGENTGNLSGWEVQKEDAGKMVEVLMDWWKKVGWINQRGAEEVEKG